MFDLGTLLVWLGMGSAHAETAIAVDLVPLGRGDLAWMDSSQSSGTLVAENDGFLQSPIRPWAGWAFDKTHYLLGLSMVRWTQSTWTGNQQTVTHLGAFRPAVQVRRYLKNRVTNAPQLYFMAGGYGVVPSAYTRSDTFTESEQVTFDEASNEDKARIAGFGGELGAGVELVFENGISVGVRTGLNLHRSFEVDEDTATFSSWLTTESAFTLGFLF